jgi:hypothetical protein
MKNLESFEKFSEAGLENTESVQITGGTLTATGCYSDGKSPSDYYDDVNKGLITFLC